MKLIYLYPLLFSVLLTTGLYAQQVTTNKGGERIVMFPDGSWRYYVASDSIYLNDNTKNEIKNKELEGKHKDFTSQNPTEELLNKLIASVKENILKLDDRIHSLADKRASLLQVYQEAKKHEGKNERTADIYLNELKNITREIAKIEEFKRTQLNFYNELKEATAFSTTSKTKLLIENGILADLTQENLDFNRIIHDYFLRSASLVMDGVRHEDYNSTFDESQEIKPTNLTKKELKRLNKDLAKQSKKEKKKVRKSIKDRQKELKTEQVEKKKRRKETKKEFKEIKNKKAREGENESQDDLNNEIYIPEPVEDLVIEKRIVPDVVEYGNKIIDINCRRGIAGELANTRRGTTTLDEEILFSHTPEETKSFFKEGDLIDCYSYFSYQKGIYHLHLSFDINLVQATSAFGGFKKNSQLSIRTIDGKLHNFHSFNASAGDRVSGTETTRYNLAYQLSRKDIKKLRKTPIDKVRVVWMTGFEDYTVFKIDQFQRQIQCLDSIL